MQECLTKAEEALKAANLCYDNSLHDSCASRCYYAMFWAAIVALEWTAYTPMSRSRLQKFVADVCSEIRDLSPEVELDISYEPFEDVDATIRVYPPTEETGELIDEIIHRRTFDILLDEGYHISILVFEPDGVKRPSKPEVAA